jgi:hypothetical protein
MRGSAPGRGHAFSGAASRIFSVNSQGGATGEGAATSTTRRPRHAGHEENMGPIERASVEDAHKKVKAGQALLVCAYEDEAKCRVLNLDGSISLKSFQSKAASLPKNQEIIFFCA